MGKHRDKGTGKHDEHEQLSKAAKEALGKAEPKTKPQTAEEMRRYVEGEK